MRPLAAFDRFAALLERRFACQAHTSEDAIRYTYFAALLEAGALPEEVELERPLPGQARAELDSVAGGETATPDLPRVTGKGRRPLRLTLRLGRSLPTDYALRVYEVSADRVAGSARFQAGSGSAYPGEGGFRRGAKRRRTFSTLGATTSRQ